jgi:hypothetical protein
VAFGKMVVGVPVSGRPGALALKDHCAGASLQEAAMMTNDARSSDASKDASVARVDMKLEAVGAELPL